MRQPPLNMGDAFVVDDGEDLGVSVKLKGDKSFEEILAMWPEEQKKDWAYVGFVRVTFFNGLGSTALGEWLIRRQPVEA